MTDCGCNNFPASLGNVTFGGNVGIGTSSPAYALDVSGGTVHANVFLATDHVACTTGFYPRIQSDVANTPLFVGASNATSGNVFVVARNDFSNPGNWLFSVSSAGNVGVRTAAPGYPLDIAAGSGVGLNLQGTAGDNFTPSIYLSRSVPSSQNQFLSFRAGAVAYDFLIGRLVNSDDLVFGPWPGGSGAIIERMRLTTGGNLGIGTTTPAHPLDVQGDVSTSGRVLASGRTLGDANGCYYV